MPVRDPALCLSHAMRDLVAREVWPSSFAPVIYLETSAHPD